MQPNIYLAKRYNFNPEGIMTLGDFLASKTLTRKSSQTRNHETKRVNLEYRRCNDKTEYTIWYTDENHGELGMSVNKAVFDLFDLPASHIDARYYS